PEAAARSELFPGLLACAGASRRWCRRCTVTLISASACRSDETDLVAGRAATHRRGRLAMTAVRRLSAWSTEIDETQRVQRAPADAAHTIPFAGAARTAAQPRNAPGRFHIVGDLGMGGMGEVVLAEDTTLGRWVALKRLRAELAANPQLRK